MERSTNPAAIEVITPAEMQFWQEWAGKTPALLRAVDGQAADNEWLSMASAALGAVLGIATLTKYIPGNWKWLSGASAAAAVGYAALADAAEPAHAQFANALERSPALKEGFANYLSKTVTAEDIQAGGIKDAILAKALEFQRMLPQAMNITPSPARDRPMRR